MSSDIVWMVVRSMLMVTGSVLAARGLTTLPDVTSFADKLQAAWPAIMSIGAMAWSLWIKWNTKNVHIDALPDNVPTVNAGSGKTDPPKNGT